jgi:hypothetical protein
MAFANFVASVRLVHNEVDGMKKTIESEMAKRETA